MCVHEWPIPFSMAEKQLALSISSNDAYIALADASIFCIKFPVITVLPHEILSLGLESFTANVVWDSIDTSNKTFTMSEDGGPNLTVTLPVGNPNIYVLAEQVQAALNSAGSKSYTVTANASTFKLQIQLTAGGGTSAMYFSSSYYLARLLGFNSIDRTLIPGEPLVSDVAVDLVGRAQVLDIHVRDVTFANALESRGHNSWSDILQRVIVDVPVFSMLSFFSTQLNWRETGLNSINSLTLQFTDKDGTPLPLHNSDWSMVIRFRVRGM